MSEEAAFLQALDARPDDMALRMVFADWLEERGDPRGELLRLTHTLTQAIDVPGRAEMEARMQTLVDQGVPAIGPFRTNSISMRFAWIPPGTCLGGEVQQRITMPTGFFLGIHQVTQAQWQYIMVYNPSRFKGEKLPVDCISWDDCSAFCQTLSQCEGQKYRLPAENEWEYACRVGSTSAYYFGNNVTKLDEYAWYCDNGLDQTHFVGQKKPNAWGLYDMHGNVWEWCSKSFIPDPFLGSRQALRGGAWSTRAQYIRPEIRFGRFTPLTSKDIGLRVCFSLE